MQRVIGVIERIADTACGDRHRGHRTVLVIMHVTVSMTEATARRSRHAAGVFRHAALAVMQSFSGGKHRLSDDACQLFFKFEKLFIASKSSI